MTAQDAAHFYTRLAQARDVESLTAIMIDLRREFPDDGDAENLVRQAEAKRQALSREGPRG